MERKNKCKKSGFSMIVWAVMAVLLCAATSLHADVTIPDDGIVYNIPGDLVPVVPGNLWVEGKLNLLPGAEIQGELKALPGSTIKIYGGRINSFLGIYTSTDPTEDPDVTVYGDMFHIGTGIPFPPSSDTNPIILFDNLYVKSELGDFSFIVFTDIPIHLRALAIQVDIDIKPGSSPNTINLGSKGVVPVAILSSADFDATTVDPETVALSGAGVAVRGKGTNYLTIERDVNGDSLIDLEVKVEIENLDPGIVQDGFATLTGSTYDGQAIEGSDVITIVP